VYPKCAVDNTCAQNTVVNNVRQPNSHVGEWDKECSNENCYGVPLMRLDLTKSDGGAPKSIRMTGQATGQRSMLTVNHGTYYIDTTVKKSDQLVFFPPLSPTPVTCNVPTVAPQECNINVFQAGGTYYIFLIYAKADTEQTYRFYAGPGSTNDPATELQVKVVQANIDPNPVDFSKFERNIDGTRVKWIGDRANGIVEVTFGAADLADFAAKMNDARKSSCQPTTYCTWDAAASSCKACKKTELVDDPLHPGQKIEKCTQIGDDSICRWASYDPHCPEGGCVGIKFTLPGSFRTGSPPDLARIQPKELVCKDANFDVKFTKVNAGACPKEATATALNDQLELNFTNVTPANCQDSTATGAFPRCSCPP
jgi:hypothetical protein